MTHTQTQGAEGAGTKTAKPGDLPYRSEWETKRTITHEDAREIAARLIASRFRRTDCETARASIPANPDYDDDLLINSYIKQQARKDAALAPPAPVATPDVRSLLHTARSGLATYGDGAFEGTIAQIDAILAFDPATPAPAATPGVPDSVREAFAAATDSPVFVHDFADPAVSSAPGCQDVSLSFVTPDHITAAFMGNGLAGTIDQARKDAVALAAAWNHVRALIAAQPAGQAGDAGAETERLREAVSKALHDNQFLDGWPEMVDPVVEAVLAARPEAPSDAGWRERVRHVKRGTEYEVLGEAEAQVSKGESNRFGEWRALYERDKLTVYRGSDGKLWCRFPDEMRDGRFETITPPSDPAPSGQAEG